MAADLIEAGVDVHDIYRRLYEGVPEPKLALLTRALERVQRFDGGRLTFARLAREDFAQTGAEESYTEGIIDHLRAVQGTKVAALARELTGADCAGKSKVSLRATDGDGRRLAHRARPERRRPSPGGGLRDDDVARRAGGVPAPRGSRTARRVGVA